jgi:outer membrane protein TolC
MKVKSKTKMIAEFIRRSAQRRFNAGLIRKSELAMALASADKEARRMARSKAFRHVFGESLGELIQEIETEDGKRLRQSN